MVLDQLAAYGTRDQVREQLNSWDQAADIVTILLPPGMSWPAIEATLLAAAPGTAAKAGPQELAAASRARGRERCANGVSPRFVVPPSRGDSEPERDPT